MRSNWCILLFLLSIQLNGQNEIIDSLRSALLEEQADTSRIKLKLNIAKELKYVGDTNYLPMLNDVIEEAEKYNRPDLEVRGFLEKGSFYDARGNRKIARAQYEKARSLCEFHQLDKELGYTLFFLAGLARYSADHQLAYDTYEEALSIFRRLKMAPQVATLIFSQAVILDNMGRFEESTNRFHDAMKQYQELENDYGIGNCYNSMGVLTVRTSDFNRAMQLYRNALVHMQRAGAKAEICNILDNIGVVHRHQDQIDSAIHYQQLALSGRKEIGDRYGQGRGLINLADDYKALKQYDEAGLQLQNALQLFQQLDDPQSLSLVLTRLSEIDLKLGNGTLAINRATEALRLAKESGSMNEEIAALKNLANLYEELGRYEESLIHLKEHEVLSDSVLNAKSLENLNELQTKYETAKKDQKILLQEMDLRGAQAELAQKGLVNRMVGLGLVGALMTIALLVWNFRQRSRLNQEKLLNLEQQKTVSTMQAMISGEERERSRIAKDLHDGLNGTLATVKMYMSGLPESAPALESNEKFQKMKSILDDTTNEVRRISHDLMPSVLMKKGLLPALEDYVSNINQAGILRVELITSGLEIRLGHRFELTLYRVIQELMNNIIKHAQAKEVTIQLFRMDGTLQVTVEDDGIGFDPSDADGGLGLESIRSRVEMLSGHSEVDSQPGKGTTVHMEFLLQRSTEKT